MQAEIQDLGRDECFQLLRSQQVGRVVHGRGPLPTIIPVNYAMDGEDVVLRTLASSQLATAAGSVVAFEVDDLEPALHAGWSVVVQGRLERARDAQDSARLASLVLPWAPGPRDLLLRITVTLVNGRRILPAGGADAHTG